MLDKEAFSLSPLENGFTYSPAKVTFSDYERIMGEAVRLNELLSQVEVTEENIGLAKKLVAKTRSQFNILDQERKDAKKNILSDFENFEKQVKEIGQVISEGENLVRSKIRELEEKEREEKKDKILKLWEEHSHRYEFTDWIKFTDWYEDRFANKTQSLNKLEEELIQWLEQRRQDIKVIDDNPDREEMMYFYKESLNLSDAMLKVTEKKKQIEQLEQTKRVQERTVTQDKEYSFTVYSENDYHNVLKFLRENKIYFSKEVKNG